MTWIAAIALLALILALLLAPAFDIRLTRRVITPILVGALFLAIALMLGNAQAYVADPDGRAALGIFGGILAGLGLFFVVLSCARFAVSNTESPPGPDVPR